MNGIEIANDMKTVVNTCVEDLTVNGKCTECGGCCGDCLCLTEAEIKRIKNYVKKNNIKPCNHIPPLTEPGTSIDLLCPFLNTNKEKEKCTIYEVRPAICQIFLCSMKTPLQMLNNASKENKDAIMGMMQDDHISKRIIHMGQTFYPDIYCPNVGDYVIVNQYHRVMQQQCEGMIFKVLKKETKYKAVIQCVQNKNIEFLYDIEGLTKII